MGLGWSRSNLRAPGIVAVSGPAYAGAKGSSNAERHDLLCMEYKLDAVPYTIGLGEKYFGTSDIKIFANNHPTPWYATAMG